MMKDFHIKQEVTAFAIATDSQDCTPALMDSKESIEATLRGIGNDDVKGKWLEPYPDFGSNRRTISIPLSIQARVRKPVIFFLLAMKFLVYRWMLFLGKKPLPHEKDLQAQPFPLLKMPHLPSSAEVTTSTLNTAEDYQTAKVDEYFKWLKEARTLPEVVSLFKQAECDIGHSEITCAKLLYFIDSNDLWKRLGYQSKAAFIQDMAECGIGTKQTYFRMVKVGRMLSELKPLMRSLSLPFDYGRLSTCYSKFPTLARVMDGSRNPYSINIKEVLDHFFNDSCREFVSYVNKLLKQPKAQEATDKSVKDENASKKSVSPTGGDAYLTMAQKRLHEEFVLGHRIVLLGNIEYAFLDSIVSFFEKCRKEEIDKLNSRSHSVMDRYFSSFSLSKYLDDLASIHDKFMASEKRYASGTGEMFSPESVKRIFHSYSRSKMELTLIQAYLLHCIDTRQELKSDMHKDGVSSTEAFAVKVLKLHVSQYRRLKKIGDNMFLVGKLRGEINLTDVGFLEKIYFLDVALDNHNHEPDKVIDCLKKLSAKQFREFARSPSYDFDKVSISRQEHKRFLPLLDKYETLSQAGKHVSFIGLRTDWEYDTLTTILVLTRPEHASRRKRYPDINWDAVSSVTTYAVV